MESRSNKPKERVETLGEAAQRLLASMDARAAKRAAEEAAEIPDCRGVQGFAAEKGGTGIRGEDFAITGSACTRPKGDGWEETAIGQDEIGRPVPQLIPAQAGRPNDGRPHRDETRGAADRDCPLRHGLTLPGDQ